MSSQDAIGYYWDFASYESGEAQAYAKGAVSYPASQSFESIDAAQGEAGNWIGQMADRAGFDYINGMWIARDGINQDANIIEKLWEKIKEEFAKGFQGARAWILESLLGSENFILRGLGMIAMSLLDALEWVAILIAKGIDELAKAIGDALEALADFFGDVFEVILKHLVDYAGEKVDTYIDFALGAK